MASQPLSFEPTGRIHRAPVGFGPAPSPRQDPNGQRFDWSKSEATTVGVTYRSTKEALDALLPKGYEIDAETPTVLFEVMELRKLPWLAGRGYNTWGVYINDVVCRLTSKPYRGSYMAVLFESLTDPITTGREELGFCKLYAELPDGKTEGGSRVHTASWLGKEFMHLEISGLVESDTQAAPARSPRSWGHPTQSGILHHRYVPTVGRPGHHDASYTTYCPAPAGKPNIVSYQTTSDFDTVKFDIAEATFEELPTLWNVVDGLRSIPRLEVLEVAVQHFQGASDLAANQRVD